LESEVVLLGTAPQTLPNPLAAPESSAADIVVRVRRAANAADKKLRRRR